MGGVKTAAAIMGVLLAMSAASSSARSPSTKAEFQRHHPCPATGERRGRCPGFIIDHVQPLCAGGADTPRNMQWQTIADARRKDRGEARECALYRRTHR